MRALERSLNRKMTKVVIAGLGRMGQATYDYLLKSGEFELSGFDREANPNSYLNEADVVILAMKPQSFGEFASTVEVDLKGKLVISIMAGISLGVVMDKLNVDKVVRVMPNLALQVGRSVSAWFASESVDEEDKASLKAILRKFGMEIQVESEEKIDEITAVSGSGPAYFCLLAEHMADVARGFGFEKELAKKFVDETLIGTALLMDDKSMGAREIRSAVSSKGGTTEAAVADFGEKGFGDIVDSAVAAAKRRAIELNNENE